MLLRLGAASGDVFERFHLSDFTIEYPIEYPDHSDFF